MLSRTVRIQITAFLVIALLGISYVAIHYVGIVQDLGASGYTVKLDLAQSGGIFTNAEVDYRGVPVGRVGAMRLTDTGVQVDLNIDSGGHIPSTGIQAAVADRSIIGEQYVDLEPQSATGPYLANGSVIPVDSTTLPPPVDRLLLTGDRFVNSLPLATLRKVINQLDKITNGEGQDLNTLLHSVGQISVRANKSLPQTIALIDDGRKVLTTQEHEAGAIKSFSHNLTLIGQQLAESNGDISRLISNTAPAATQVGGLFNDIQGSGRTLLTGLLTTSTVVEGNKQGLQDLLTDLPKAISIGGKVITPEGVNVGLVPTFFDPLPCTEGYQGTVRRRGLDTAGNPPLNTAAGCTAPSRSGVDVRGSQNEP